MTEKTPPGDRIAKVMSRAGIASRRDAEKMILEGRVKVNGKVVERAALNVTPDDKIVVDGKPIKTPKPQNPKTPKPLFINELLNSSIKF